MSWQRDAPNSCYDATSYARTNERARRSPVAAGQQLTTSSRCARRQLLVSADSARRRVNGQLGSPARRVRSLSFVRQADSDGGRNIMCNVAMKRCSLFTTARRLQLVPQHSAPRAVIVVARVEHRRGTLRARDDALARALQPIVYMGILPIRPSRYHPWPNLILVGRHFHTSISGIFVTGDHGCWSICVGHHR
jgi:hypothetical protein